MLNKPNLNLDLVLDLTNSSISFDCEPMKPLYFSQTRFEVGHFQPIRPVQQNMHDTKKVDQMEKDNFSISDPLFE